MTEAINNVGSGLLASGIDRGDRVAIVSENRPEWNIVDLAVQQIGAISVPVDPRITDEERAVIFNDAQVRMAFVSVGPLYETVRALRARVPSLEKIYTFDEVPDGAHWREILGEISESDLQFIQRRKAEITAGDLATIVYTSGTTGNPKGVMLSHSNIISNIRA